MVAAHFPAHASLQYLKKERAFVYGTISKVVVLFMFQVESLSVE